MRIRNVLLKSMDQTIKANSNVNLLQSCNEPKEYEIEQKMSTEEEVRVERDQKMMSYFGKIDNNMTRFFSK